MKIAIENETQLISCQSVIAEEENIFQKNEEETEDEPIFFQLVSETGIDAGELEKLAPETKLENILSTKEYKAWKSLSITEKRRTINRIHNSSEYKEFAKAIDTLRLKRQRPNAYAQKNTGENKWVYYQNPAKNVSVLPSNGYMDTKKSTTEAINCGKSLTKKLAREYVQLPGRGVQTFGTGTDSKTEKDVYKRATEMNYFVIRVIGKIAVATGTPLLVLLLPVFLFFMLLAILFMGNTKASENAGIMPYYAQGDYTEIPFNGNTISSDGCGITSMAMIISLYKNETITPETLAQVANADAKYNTVLSHKAINYFAELYELGPVEEMGGPNKNCCSSKKFDLAYVQKRIQEGSPVIVSVSGGYYNPSGGGHYIALYGMGTNGVFVYDAGSRQKYQDSVAKDGSAWGIVFESAKHIWIFEPYTGGYLTGSSNEESVYLNLKQAGFSDAATAGIIGNMYQESSHGGLDLNPLAESKDGSIGLLQWSSGRRKSLEELAKNRNKEWTVIDVQLEFLFQELNSGTQWKWTKYAASHYSDRDNISVEEFKKLSDPQLAAEVFQAKFVRPNFEKSNLEYRKSKAKEVFEKYINQNKKGDGNTDEK